MYLNYPNNPTGTADGREFPSATAFSEYLIQEVLISTVPWDDAGKYIRFSVTFEADTEQEEIEVIREIKNRLSKLKLRF